MQGTFDKRVLIAIGLIVALLFADTGLDYYNTRKLHRDAAQVARTHAALAALQDVDSMMKDAQAGHGSYLITGDSSYLAPWHDGAAAIAQKVERLACLTADSPRPQAYLPALRDLAAELQSPDGSSALPDEAAIEARHAGPTDACQKAVDSIRSHVSAMKQEEQRLLKERQRQTDRRYQVAQTTSLLTAVLGLTLVSFLICLLRRNLLERADATAGGHWGTSQSNVSKTKPQPWATKIGT